MIKYKLTEKAKQLKEAGICDCTPVRGTSLSAGMDLKLCSEEPIVIIPYETVKVYTGLHIWLGELESIKIDAHMTYYLNKPASIQLAGLYLPRSSNKGLQLENTVGLLDCDFQGESFLKLYNKTEDTIVLKPGERIAQLVVFPVIMENWQEVESFEEETERGDGGDGSTGKN